MAEPTKAALQAAYDAGYALSTPPSWGAPGTGLGCGWTGRDGRGRRLCFAAVRRPVWAPGTEESRGSMIDRLDHRRMGDGPTDARRRRPGHVLLLVLALVVVAGCEG